jgi:hypothetical protein
MRFPPGLEYAQPGQTSGFPVLQFFQNSMNQFVHFVGRLSGRNLGSIGQSANQSVHTDAILNPGHPETWPPNSGIVTYSADRKTLMESFTTRERTSRNSGMKGI